MLASLAASLAKSSVSAMQWRSTALTSYNHNATLWCIVHPRDDFMLRSPVGKVDCDQIACSLVQPLSVNRMKMCTIPADYSVLVMPPRHNVVARMGTASGMQTCGAAAHL